MGFSPSVIRVTRIGGFGNDRLRNIRVGGCNRRDYVRPAATRSGYSFWTSFAIDRIFGSSNRGATICRPTGKPSLVMPAGTLPAGRLTSVTRNAGAIQST